MKKKLTIAVLLFFLSSLTVQAAAVGKLEVIQENLHLITQTANCLYYAELTNTGDKPVEFSRGLLELTDAEGNTVDSLETVLCYPRVVQPGENAFFAAWKWVDLAKHTISGHLFSLTQQTTLTQKVARLETRTSHKRTDDGYHVRDLLIARVKNTTEETIHAFEAAFVVRGEGKNILYIDTYGWQGYQLGIPPGSSAEVTVEVDPSYLQYWSDNGLVPSTLETLAYVATGI